MSDISIVEVFDAGFSEAKPTSLRGPFPSDKANSTEEYDYYSDSDLDDEEDLGCTQDELDVKDIIGARESAAVSCIYY